MNISSRFDAYLTNVTLPWENKASGFQLVSAIQVFKVVKKEDSWEFLKMWIKTFSA